MYICLNFHIFFKLGNLLIGKVRTLKTKKLRVWYMSNYYNCQLLSRFLFSYIFPAAFIVFKHQWGLHSEFSVWPAFKTTIIKWTWKFSNLSLFCSKSFLWSMKLKPCNVEKNHSYNFTRASITFSRPNFWSTLVSLLSSIRTGQFFKFYLSISHHRSHDSSSSVCGYKRENSSKSWRDVVLVCNPSIL